MGSDLLVHQRLGEHGHIHLVMTVSTVTHLWDARMNENFKFLHFSIWYATNGGRERGDRGIFPLPLETLPIRNMAKKKRMFSVSDGMWPEMIVLETCINLALINIRNSISGKFPETGTKCKNSCNCSKTYISE